MWATFFHNNDLFNKPVSLQSIDRNPNSRLLPAMLRCGCAVGPFLHSHLTQLRNSQAEKGSPSPVNL